jgi:hypothetical protein
MKTTVNLILSLTILLLFQACSNNPSEAKHSIDDSDGIQVIQFHSSHRCMTCNKIEALTKSTLEAHLEIKFKLIDVDDPANDAIAEEFEATGTALFLYNPSNGTKKDMTDFAFLYASNEDQFITILQQEIEDFK